MMSIKTYGFNSARTLKIFLGLAGGLLYFSASNVFWSLRINKPETEHDTKVPAFHLSIDMNNSVEMISNGTGIDGGESLVTSEALTQEGVEAVEAVRHNFNDSSISQQQEKPLIINIRTIGGDASINATYNYTQLASPLRNEYMENRSAMFDSWFEQGSGELLQNADKNGPILDFIISGFPKCGTTTVSANLAHLAPMDEGDICTNPAQTVFYAYKSWPPQHGKQKLLRGSKCPRNLETEAIVKYSNHLPRTKIIMGIRHPILWFQSFWNMQVGRPTLKKINHDPYRLTEPCKPGEACSKGCRSGQLFCLRRGRFHLTLAALGKTALSKEERKFLSPNDKDGGENLKVKNIRNPIFVYEQNELSKDYVWDEMAKYLNVAAIPHEEYRGSHGIGKGNRSATNFCEERLDDFRAMMMPYAYELSVWMQDYFIPVAKNESSGVTIPNPNAMIALVEEYKKDPCGRLYRLQNGTYVLNTNRTTIVEVSQG